MADADDHHDRPGQNDAGCCDSSPNRHATAHFRATDHPLIQSFEPGEDWYYCYVDEVAFEVDEPTSAAHS